MITQPEDMVENGWALKRMRLKHWSEKLRRLFS